MLTSSLPIYNEAKAIAAFGGRLAIAFSLGRDSAVMLHILSQLTDLKKHKIFYWSRYPKILPYQRRYVDIVEKKYGIKIDIRLHYSLIGKKQMPWVVEYVEQNKCDLAVFGFRMDESLQRRGMLKRFKDGIDYQRKWAYPLRSFTAKSIRGYVNSNKVPLSIEYQLGFKHDWSEHRGFRAWYLRELVSEEDYKCAVEQDPNIEIDYVRTKNSEEFYKVVFLGEDPAKVFGAKNKTKPDNG